MFWKDHAPQNATFCYFESKIGVVKVVIETWTSQTWKAICILRPRPREASVRVLKWIVVQLTFYGSSSPWILTTFLSLKNSFVNALKCDFDTLSLEKKSLPWEGVLYPPSYTLRLPPLGRFAPSPRTLHPPPPPPIMKTNRHLYDRQFSAPTVGTTYIATAPQANED